MWNRFISEYLNFTKKERTGTLVLLLMIVILLILPFLFPFFIHQNPIDPAAFKSQIDKLSVKQVDSVDRYAKTKYNDNNFQSFREPGEKNSFTKN